MKDLSDYVSEKKRSVTSADKNLNYFQNRTISLDCSKEETDLSNPKREVPNDLIDSVSTNTPELKSESLDTLDKSAHDLIGKEETLEHNSNIYPSSVRSNSNSQNHYNSGDLKKVDTSIAANSDSKYNSYITGATNIDNNQSSIYVPVSNTIPPPYYTPPLRSISPCSIPTYPTDSFYPPNKDSTLAYRPFVSPITRPEAPRKYSNINVNPNTTMDFLNMYSSGSPRSSISQESSIYNINPNIKFPENQYAYDKVPSVSMHNPVRRFAEPTKLASYDFTPFNAAPPLMPATQGMNYEQNNTKRFHVSNVNPGSVPEYLPRIDLGAEFSPVSSNANIAKKIRDQHMYPNPCKTTVQSQPDYTRAIHSSKVVEKKFLHEGFDTIRIPKYREVEVVEKLVEVPVVRTVNKIVHKHEIKEVEKIVKKPINKYIETKIEVPELHYKDKMVEVPEFHEIIKIIEKPEIKERIIYKSRIERKIIPKYIEVPVVKIVDKYEEYDDIQEVIKTVPVKKIVEIPNEVIKRVKVPTKKIIEQPNYVPVIEYRDVPVEKIRYVPKVQTIEHFKRVPKIIDIPVSVRIPKIEYIDRPVYVNKYVDHYVNIPVSKKIIPVYKQSGKKTIEIPIHRPYIVNHDTIVPKNINNSMLNGSCSVYTRRLDINSLSPMRKNELFELVNRDSKGLSRSATISNFSLNSTFGSAPAGMNNNRVCSLSRYGRYQNRMNGDGSSTMSFRRSLPHNIFIPNQNMYQPVVRSNSFAHIPTNTTRAYTSNKLPNDNYGLPSIVFEDQSNGPTCWNIPGSSYCMNYRNDRNNIGMHSYDNFDASSMSSVRSRSTSPSIVPRVSLNSPPIWRRRRSCSVTNRSGNMNNQIHSISQMRPQNSNYSSLYRNRLQSSNMGSSCPSMGSIDGISTYAVEYVGELNNNFARTRSSSGPLVDRRNLGGSNYSFAK